MPSRTTWRILILTFAVSGLLLAVGVGGAWYVHRANRDISDSLDENLAAVQSAGRLVLTIREVRLELGRFAETSEQSNLTAAQSRLDLVERELRGGRLEISDGDSLGVGFQQLQLRLASLLVDQDLDRQQTTARELIATLSRDLLPLAEERLVNRQKLASETSRQNQLIADRIGIGLLILGICGAVAGMLFGFGIARSIHRSLVQISIPVQDMAGRLNEDAPCKTANTYRTVFCHRGKPMKRSVLLSFCLVFLPAQVSSSLYSAELANQGATGWKIVLPDEPTIVEKTAARELAEHLKLVTGADFPTVAEKDIPTGGKSLIFVGRTAKAPKKDYKFDEILIKMDSGNLVLAGHEKRGCLYAVYSFLQDIVGVRWWTPEDTFLPSQPTLSIPDDLDISYAPQLISREMYHRNAQPTVFSARMKGNGFLTPEYGGAVRIINFVHSFYKYLPPEKYFADHPDWYSEIDGQRKHERAQLCLTNEEMIQELIKNVLKTLRDNPDATMIDVSQNDWYGFCTCEKCRALDDAEESHAGTLVAMLNKVAEAVEKEFPDVLVESLAYQYTRKPPKTIKPRHNVLIRLCTIECSFIQPLDGEQNKKFAADIEGWSKIAEHLFIWDYTTNYNDYLGPHPNLRVLVPNVRYFVKHGAIGLFAEGEGDDFCELKNWLLMRVMWEPHLESEALIDEFVRGYYGEAVAPLIKQYWNVLIAQAEKEKIYLGCFGMNSTKWIDLPTLNQVTEIMNQAVETATNVYGSDSDELRRLRKSKMGIDHVWLSRYYPLRCEAREKELPFLGPKDPLQAAAEFTQLCQQFKTKAAVISQEDRFDLYLEGLKAGFIAQKNPPDICKGVPEDAWVIFDALSFNNYNNAATIIDDPAGWNGKSVRMGTKVDWNTNYTPPVRGKYRILASLRCEGTIQEGRLGSWGVYDPQGKKSLKSMTLNVTDFAVPDGSFDKEFRWIDLGAVDFVPGAYFWFAHGHRPELDAIFVDRVVLIGAE